jgi:hypothetical protein
MARTNFSYNGTVINDSPTIIDKAGAEITTGPFTALAYKDGALVAATAALVPFGITTAEMEDRVPAGEDVTIQVKDIGAWKAGAAFARGAALASDANGCAVTAAAGKFILAFALEEATAAGQVVRVQIAKAGYAV